MWHLEYEGIHTIRFHYGTYGHYVDTFPLTEVLENQLYEQDI